LQYSTTDKFLEFIGVKTLVELPASDVLSPRRIDELLQTTANIKPPADADMGLPIEENDGEGAALNFAGVTVAHSTPPFPNVPAPAEQSAPPSTTTPDSQLLPS
jgi:segregation and condensation protein B